MDIAALVKAVGLFSNRLLFVARAPSLTERETPVRANNPDVDAISHWRYRRINDALGPASGRFFGDGYRKVDQLLHHVSVGADPVGNPLIRGTVTLRYPEDWSVKSGSTELRPHLSSIDAAVFAVQLAEYYLIQGLGLDAAQCRTAWVRSMQMWAGSRPQLELADIGVEARVVESYALPRSLCGQVTVMECRIGGFRVRYEVEHESARDAASAGVALSEAGEVRTAFGYYGDGFKRVQREIEHLRADPEFGSIEALVSVTDPGHGAGREGLGGDYLPALSPIDAIVVVAQLCQVLLYGMDKVDRQESGTLWMRRISFEAKTPYQPIDNPFVATTSTVKSRISDMGGKRWRSAELQSRLLGVRGTCALTHALPEAANR